MTILKILYSLRGQALSNPPNQDLMDALGAHQATIFNLHTHHPLLPEDIQNLFKALNQIITINYFNLESTRRHRFAGPYIRFNQILEDSAITLADCLKSNTTLTQINLKNNPIGSHGINALVLCLTENFTLTQLIIGGYFIRDEEIQALAQALRSIDTRLITPELLIISEPNASDDILEELDAAFADHKEKVSQKAKAIEQVIEVHFPPPLASIVNSYNMLGCATPLVTLIQENKKAKMSNDETRSYNTKIK